MHLSFIMTSFPYYYTYVQEYKNNKRLRKIPKEKGKDDAWFS